MRAGHIRSNETHQSYLGDGVYASFDGIQVWVRADRDGMCHEIAIEGATYARLTEYFVRLIETIKRERIQQESKNVDVDQG